MKSLTTTIEQLENWFDAVNRKYYANELPRPIMTIAPDEKKKAYGWCTTYKAWTDGKQSNYEINISANYANRSMTETISTIMHEAVHLYNILHNVKDCTRNGFYHNKNFKNEAERRGLKVTQSKKYGYAHTDPDEEAIRWISTLEEKKIMYRPDIEKPETKKQKSFKYVCPHCGAIARTTKQIRLICGNCYFSDEEIDCEEIEMECEN